MNTNTRHISFMVAMSMSLMVCAFSARSALAACKECGTVTDVRTVKIEGKASGVGAVGGGVLGGVIGHQIGGGRGKDLATVGGVVGGAYAGHQVEKKVNERTEYRVIVEMEDGSSKTFKYPAQTSYKVGDAVKVKGGKLTRQ